MRRIIGGLLLRGLRYCRVDGYKYLYETVL
jgi:hypothetical protein